MLYVSANLLRVRLLVCASVWVASFGALSAQTVLRGQINAPDGAPVEFATVLLLQDTGIVARAVSDDSGRFWLTWNRLSNYTYRLKIARLGYRTIETPLSPDTSGELGMLLLAPDTALLLQEAVVAARAPLVERKADRLVFYVENSLSAAGGTAWDALRATPGLTTTEQGEISANGKGVGLLVDDKLLQLSGDQLMAFLGTLKSDDIRRIEIITNPPARYDAAGLNGLVNIVLKKDPRLGLNGVLRAGYHQTTYDKYNLGATLNYRAKRLNAYSSLVANTGQYFMREILWQYFAAPAGNEGLYYDQLLHRKRRQSGQSARIGLDYFARPNVTAGVLYNGNFGRRRPDDNTRTAISPDRVQIDSTLFTWNRSDQTSANNALNANLNIRLDSLLSSLNIDADWLDFRSDNTLANHTAASPFFAENGIYTAAFLNDTRQHIRIGTVKVDWIQHLPGDCTLEAGGKYNDSRTDNDFVAETWNSQSARYEYDSLNSNRLAYREQIAALYASFAGTLRGGVEYKFGLRGEQTNADIHSVTQDERVEQRYFKLFPTVYLLYNFGDENSVGVDLGRRIQRPAFWELNPFRIYLTPFSYSEGNPRLQPAFTYEGTLHTSWRGKHHVSLYAGQTDDLFTQFPLQDNANRTIRYTRGNLIQQRYVGLSYQTTFSPTAWWNVSANLDLLREQQRSRYADLQADYTVTAGSLYLVNAFKIAPKRHLSGEITAHYSSPSVMGLYQRRATAHIAAGIKAKLFRERADLTLYAFDIFRTTTARADVSVQDQRSYSEQFFDMQGLRLTLAWKFGSNSVAKNRERRTGNTEETGRL